MTDDGQHTMVLVAFGDPDDPTGQRVLPPKWSCVEHGPTCLVFPALTDGTEEDVDRRRSPV